MNLNEQIPELVKNRLMSLAQDFNQCEDVTDCKLLLMYEAECLAGVLNQMIHETHET